jgi:hypothetical protein
VLIIFGGDNPAGAARVGRPKDQQEVQEGTFEDEAEGPVIDDLDMPISSDADVISRARRGI